LLASSATAALWRRATRDARRRRGSATLNRSDCVLQSEGTLREMLVFRRMAARVSGVVQRLLTLHLINQETED